MIKEQTTLYYRQGGSDKQYQATLEDAPGGYVVNISYGRRGSAQQTGTKTPTAVTLEAARAIYERVLNEKKAKGYTPGEDGTPYAHTENEGRDSGLRPQLLNSIPRDEIAPLLASPEWWMQEKHDGRRQLLKKEGSIITGINRRGLTIPLPQPLVDEVSKCQSDFILDGESMGDRFIVFDLLQLGDQDLRSQSYLERFLMLMHLFSSWERQNVQIIRSFCVDGEKRRMFEMLELGGAEGVVFKKIDEPYTESRPASGGIALKFKFHETASFVVCRHNDQRSVSLVLFDEGVVRNAGSVAIPANHEIPPVGSVVEVRYLYAFKESGSIYQPVYLGVRDDLTSDDCTLGQLKWKTAA